MHRSHHASNAALAAVAVFAALTTAACSGPAAKPAPATDLAAAPRDAVRDGGTLRWAVDDVPGTLNTFQSDADATTSQVAAAVLPSLFTVDDRGRPQRDADYLESAEVVATSPQQIVDYKLNPKAVWSDGRPISADDFAAQWKALNGASTAFWTSHNDGYDRIASVVRGADEHAVRVTFNRPLAGWQALFTPLYPSAVTSRPDAFNDGARGTIETTAGPFTVQDLDGKAGTVTLGRNAKWWGDRPKLDRLVLTAVPTDRRAAALADGSLDVAQIDPAALPAVSKDRGIAVRRAPQAAFTQLTLNGSSGPLADERVRRAVARAIDRKAIAGMALGPAGLPAKPLGNHLLLASQYGYADNSSAIGGTSVKSAQALLGAAGWQPGQAAPATPAAAKAGAPGPGLLSSAASSSGAPALSSGAPVASSGASAAPSKSGAGGVAAPDGVVEPAAVRTDKSGHPLSLRFVVPADSAMLGSVADRIAHMLAGIGVRTEIAKVSDDSFFRDHIASGDFDLALYSWPGSAYPADDARPVYAKPVPAPDGSLTVQQNYARVGTDQIDQLLDRATSELDAGKAHDLAERADARIWAAAGSIPLYQRPEVVAEKTSVANAGAFGFATPRYQDIGFRK